MSLFSRFLRKAPPGALPREKSVESAPAVPAGPTVPSRAEQAAKEEETLKAAVDAQDVETIARLVVAGTSTKVRQQAAHAIGDLARLRQLIKDVRGGDKSVYRILTAKRDELVAQARKLEQAQAQINSVAVALERHSQRPYDHLFVPTLAPLENRWKALAPEAAPATLAAAQAAIERCRQVIAEHQRQVAAESARAQAAAEAAAEGRRRRELEERTASQAAAEQARVLEEERRAQAERMEAQALAHRQIGGLIRKAHGALNEGSTGRAAGLRRALEEKLGTAGVLPNYLANQLHQLDAKLNELKDWKSFSVTPKRMELMEEMESLVGATLDPPVLAQRIRELQGQWRTLSKGAGENLEADWERFREAAHKAYEPCREYFDAQALVRQENLQRRTALLERLAAFEAQHNWEQPDWRLVLTALRDSRQQWRRYSPVERAAGRTLQEKFDGITAALQGRLDGEYARNSKERALLIERARRLLASEDSRKAIEDVKELQLEWRAVGPVPREAGQQLWEEFRQQCDAVFQRRQQEFADYNAALAVNKAKAIALCEELERIGSLSGRKLLEEAARLADLRAGFESSGEFPRAEARGIRDRFERALEHCEESVARQQEHDAERSWTELLEAADRVHAFRLAISQNADPERTEALRQAAETYIAAVDRWPRGGLEAIRREFGRQDGADLAANEVTLRRLCIRAEILADVPTPPEDQAARREFQVQRLMQSMGQGITDDRGQLDEMAIEWVGSGPAGEAVYPGLLGRFKRCRDSSAAPPR